MNKITSVAKLNYKNYKYFSRNTCVNMIISSVLFLMITSFGLSIRKLHENYNYSNYELREVVITTDEYSKLTDDDLTLISLIPNVENVHVFYSLYPKEYMTISIDEYQLKSIYTFGAHVNFSTFSQKDILKKNNGEYFEPIIFGRHFNGLDKKKAIIDENYTYILGYKNPQDILGKKLSISINSDIVDDIEIIGVHDYRLGSGGLNKLNDISEYERIDFLEFEYNLAPVILSHDVINLFNVNNEDIVSDRTGQFNVRVFVDSATNVSQVCNNISKITDNYLSSEILEIEQKAKSIKDLQIFTNTISFAILIVAFTSIANVLIIKIDEQKFLTKLMQIIGYSKKDIKLIYIYDNMIVYSKAIFISLAIAFAGSVILDMLLMEHYALISTIDRFLFIIDPLLLIVYFSSLFLIVIGITYFISSKQLMDKKKW
jgi:hypothetical protein